ncbi:hypothetical protein [Streptomyces collinus]|uniref:arsenate reductase/protein-tyrosine-phosphatase family protein n=1 Tax=Streptomyces collinus TaxID=42684 RepID=UPI0036EB41AF
MIQAARRLGLDLNGHRAQQLTREMLVWADTVLTMDASVLEVLRDIADDDQPKLRLYLNDRDVPRPDGREPGDVQRLRRPHRGSDGSPRWPAPAVTG